MSSLFTVIARAFPRELISHLAARLGEGENGMKRALDGVLPMIMGGMARQAQTSDAQLLFECNNRAYQTTLYGLGSVTGMLGILGSGTAADSALMQGETLLLGLFGNSWQAIAVSASRYAQVKRTTASTLLTLVSAVLPGLLGQYAEHNRLSAAALTANLIGIKSQLNTLLPFDLRAVANSLGLNGDARAAKAGNRQGWIVSWMLLLTAALGITSLRPRQLAPVVPAASLALGQGYWLAAQLAGQRPGRR
ncbi:DUF937 domain-containing protein [Hymenobacter artigasi]|uniref:DUF1275 domain-containing protein n=1 Tax=Hymenobacter artigasi TaxID=2719616 RepID=A0ABX1HNV5_9BACT|nr:DUF937 domain-containing protein [Hymenobacter artigasi]NKI90591.1 hypothetical protein [Hymenobacter artigasi]